MVGAILTIKEWRNECQKHLRGPGLLECENCRIKQYCKKSYPGHWSDEDIREIVVILNGGGEEKNEAL